MLLCSPWFVEHWPMQNEQIKCHKDCQFEITSKSQYSFCHLRIGFIILVVLFSDIWGIYFLITVFCLIFWHLKDKMREQSNQSHSACLQLRCILLTKITDLKMILCSVQQSSLPAWLVLTSSSRDLQHKLCQIVSCIFFQSSLGKCLILLREKERKLGRSDCSVNWN